MIIAYISNFDQETIEGIIGSNDDEVSYITSNDMLEEVLNTIIDQQNLNLYFNENLEEDTCTVNNLIDINSSNYLVAVNNYLPYPWKILKIEYFESDDLVEMINSKFNGGN